MAIYNILVDTTKRKIINYSEERTVLVIRNRDSLNNVEISEVLDSNAPYFTILPNQAYSFIKALGDDTIRELYARATTGTAVLEIIEYHAGG